MCDDIHPIIDSHNDSNIDHLYTYYSDDPDYTAPYAVELNQPELEPTENYDFF